MEQGLAFRVSGRVQGVGFRWFVKQTADGLGLTGWVRNEPDGSVRGEAEGEAGLLKEFAATLRRGNRLSAVSGLTEEPLSFSARYDSFEIRH